MKWVLVILSLTGVVLNIYKRKECFYVWALTNLSWAIYDIYIGQQEQGLLFIVYFGLALWGIYKWKNCPSI